MYMERATGRDWFKKYNHIIIREVHTHTLAHIHTSSVRFFYSHTLTRIYNNNNNIHTYLCINALSLALAHSLACWMNTWTYLNFIYVYTPFNFCLHSLMAWLRPIPEFFNGFFMVDYVRLSLSLLQLFASLSFRCLAVGKYVVFYLSMFFFVLICWWYFSLSHNSNTVLFLQVLVMTATSSYFT